MAKANYWQRGDVLDYVNTGDTVIAAGTVIALGTDRIGIAATDIPANGLGSVTVEGVFAMPKAATLAVAVGDKVYYNKTNDNLDKTADGGILAGYAVANAAAADTEVYVKLQG